MGSVVGVPVVIGGSAASSCNTEIDLELLDAALDYIRPALRYDGGDVVLLGVSDDGVVELDLVGSCAGCPMSEMTLTAGIERILMDRVPGVSAVRTG